MPSDVNAADPPPSRRHRCSYSSEIHFWSRTVFNTSGLRGRRTLSSKFALTAFPHLQLVSFRTPAGLESRTAA